MFNTKKVESLKNDLHVSETHRKYEKLQNDKWRKRIIDLETEVRKLHGIEEKVREQTDADMYFICAKTMKLIEKGETKESETIKQHLTEIDRMSALRNQMASPLQPRLGSPITGLFGSTGLI